MSIRSLLISDTTTTTPTADPYGNFDYYSSAISTHTEMKANTPFRSRQRVPKPTSLMLTTTASTWALAFVSIYAATRITTSNAFQIQQPLSETLRTVGGRSHLEAFSFQTAGSLLISDDLPSEAAIAAASDASEAFTDQIDYFGDPMIRNLFIVFGGVILVLSGLSVLSQKVDSAIEGVVVDFESVLKSNPEFKTKWQEIQLQLEPFESETNDEEASLKRKQKLFEIMESLYETEPTLMKKINSKMEALKK